MTDAQHASEQWRKIPGVDSRYEISDQGRVRSLVVPSEPRILRPSLRRGYHILKIRPERKYMTISLSRAVLLAFVGPGPEGFHAAHLDGNRVNNRLPNLAWVDQSENESHKNAHGTSQSGEAHWCAKLTDAQVLEIRQEHANGVQQKVLADRFGVRQQTVSRVCRRTNWRHL